MSSYDATAMGAWGTYRVDLDGDGYEANDTTDPVVNPFGKYLDPADNKWKKPVDPVYPASKAPVDFSQLYSYNDAADFQTRVDNSLAGQMRDCGECHVGGGAMEYIPVKPGTDLSQPGARRALRDVSIASGNYTAYNYFIGQYTGTDADGNVINTGEVYETNYANTGVLEMDCLMCHMEGYSWEKRKDEVRLGKFDASRAMGAGLATNATSGTTVTYDPLMVTDGGDGNLTLTGLAADAIKASPPSKNCSSCHFDMHQVDWKKRGTSWDENMAYETEVHVSLGCMGCHEPDDGVMNSMGEANGTTTWSGAANSVPGHDPTKGMAPFSSLWNNTDGTIKSCENCHVDQVAGNHGAPDPTGAHQSAGLTAMLVQNGRDGVIDASHLDIIHCSACHTRKLGHGPLHNDGTGHGSLYQWGTGGAMVDSTGPDAEGRVTDHENLYVERTMEDNLCYAWDKSYKKITPRNALVTMFWRDYAGIDINADGQGGGMDPVNPSHVRNVMENFGYEAMTVDGDVNATEFGKIKSALLDPAAGLPAYGIGANSTNSAIKLSFMGVLFQANHNTSPAEYAWGAGGCQDCHSPGAGFYNGTYELKPRDLQLDLDPGQIGPFTKVNGTQPSDFHPTTFAKAQYGVRSIAIQVASDNSDLRAVDRSEFLYENDMTAAGGSPRIGVDGNTYTTREDFVAYLNTVGQDFAMGIHPVHTSPAPYGQGLACTTCHSGTTDAGDGTYDVNGTFTVNYKQTAEKCNEWTVEDDPASPDYGEFVCADGTYTEDVGILSCTTACHGTTGSDVYDENGTATRSWGNGTDGTITESNYYDEGEANDTTTRWGTRW